MPLSGPAPEAKRAQERKERARPNAAVARGLGRALARAKSPKAKRAVLLNAMKALRIGVYSGRGKRLVRGFERRQSDFVLYDFELTLLAESLHDERGFVSYEDMAAQLTRHGVTARGEALPPEVLRSVTRSTTRKAMRKPNGRLAIVPLTVREIGRARSAEADTSREVPLDAKVFDPVQATLIYIDVLAGADLRVGRSNAANRGAAAARDGGCLEILPNGGISRAGKIGSFLVGLLEAKWAENAGAAAAWATVVTDRIHGEILGLAMDFRPAASGQVLDTHYGPADHPISKEVTPGTDLVFQVGVQMLDDLPERVVKCGALIGLTFPKKGPVADIPIEWDGVLQHSDFEKLQEHGTITRKDEKTGADGLALLIVDPREEIMPGLGREQVEIGVVQPSARYLEALGSTLGIPVDAAGGKLATIPWSIAFHEQRGTLGFQSRLRFSNAFGHYDYHTEAVVPVALDRTTHSIVGQGSIYWREFSGGLHGQNFECGDGNQGVYDEDADSSKPGTFSVGSVRAVGPAGLTVIINPGQPVETYRFTVTGACPTSGTIPDVPLWTGYWGFSHSDEYIGGDPGLYAIEGWVRDGADWHYSRESTGTLGSATITDTTTMDLTGAR
jgi:hypothetical protein